MNTFEIGKVMASNKNVRKWEQPRTQGFISGVAEVSGDEVVARKRKPAIQGVSKKTESS